MPASSVRELSRQWTELLAPYRRHRNDEHREALVEEAARYTGLHLENDLCRSEYWSKAPLARRAAVLLFLVDRGVVVRSARHGRRSFEPIPGAEMWASFHEALVPYLIPTLELIAAMRREQIRSNRFPRP